MIQSISTTLVLLFAAKGVTYKYILNIVDAFTRYVYLKPVKSTKSHNFIRALSEYFGIFGVPRKLISDRGTSFTSASFKRFMHDKSIKHILNAVATPRANGQVEQYNKVIIDALTAKSVGSPENMWDEHLPDVQWGMKNTLNKGINRTPSEVLFGTRPAGISDSRLLSGIAADVTNQTENVRTEIREEINSHVKAYQQYHKGMYDKKRCQPINFKVGDLVRIERQVQFGTE